MQKRIKFICYILTLSLTVGTVIFSALWALGIPQRLAGLAGM